MDIILYIVGAIIFIISIIAGLFSGGFFSFLISIAGGFASALVFFALAKIIENQQYIIYKLDNEIEAGKKARSMKKKICLKCGREFDADYNSCPHCGNRE